MVTSVEDIVEKLRECDFFSTAPAEFLKDLAGEVEIENVDAGSQIVCKGDTGNTMYMIGQGTVEIHDGEAVISELHGGDVFGELSALLGEVRTASVRAVSDCVLYRLDQPGLYNTLGSHIDAYRSLIAGLCHRGRSMAEDARDRTVKVRLFEHELDIGRTIQAGFLPDTLPQLEGWDLTSHFQSAREVAGDFYDVFEINCFDQVALIVGDVCGKGVGAALFMTLFRSLLRATMLSLAETAQRDKGSLEQVLTQTVVFTNAYIATTHGKSSMFASVFIALVDPASGELLYINGGHEPPFLVAGSQARRLDITGPALGLFPDARYEAKRTIVAPGELVFVYTDGVPEAMDVDKNQFGEERLLQILQEASGSSAAAVAELLSALGRYTKGAEQHDDITILALRHSQ